MEVIMSVYVDRSRYSFRNMTMCHMVADTIEELHEMADKIGVNRRWFQNCPTHPHYDVCMEKRKLAIQYGAIVVTNKQMVEVLRKYKK
jgi:hypothetical protein